MSAFLCFTKNMIIILDLNMNIVQVNDQYLTFSELSKEDLIGRNILEKWTSNHFHP
ncbi:PAS domain S-box protein [Methanospirillum sp.]